jgi:hypothetical protein
MIRLYLTLFACLFFNSAAAFGADRQIDGWLLVQQHKQLGTHYVYLTHDAVKIVNKNFQFVVLLAPPYHEVAIYRPDDHVTYDSTLSDFQKSTFIPPMIRSSISKAGKPPQLEKIGEETIHGLHINKFRPQYTNDELWAISNIDLAPPIFAAIHAYYQFDNQILPYRKVAIFGSNFSAKDRNAWLNVSINDAYKGKTVFFDTRSAQKMKFTAKDFAYPVGFKKLDSATQVFMSKSGASKLSTIIEDMGIGDALGKPEPSGTSAQPKK